ncbi:MAG TPA: hypothetical protein VF555_16345 [Variovorax sp.]
MKFALYIIDNKAVIQWQDTALFNYDEPTPPFARIQLADDLPDFDVNAPTVGWWVVDGALTREAPAASQPKKYALYNGETGVVLQWQDTSLANYDPPSPPLARLELPANTPGFDVNAPTVGWWVVDGALTQSPPPEPLAFIGQRLKGQVSYTRAAKIAEGIVLPDETRFQPSSEDLLRITLVAMSPAQAGVTGVDVQIGETWMRVNAVDLPGACTTLLARREACYTNERTRHALIDQLVHEAKRAELEGFDVQAGWPD